MTTKPKTAREQTASTDLTSECRQVQEIIQPGDREKHAASMEDEELLAHVCTTLHNLRDNLPYLRVARDRFAKPGRRLPVEGNPTWTEWVTANLNQSVRTVQRWLEEPKPKKDKKARQVKPLKDWPDAMRRANDLVTAATRLKAKSPVGTDVLMQPLKELESLVAAGSKAAATTTAATVGNLNVAASRVRELAREFVAIKDQFEDEEQFYLDRLLAELILGEPEPTFSSKQDDPPGTTTD